MNLTKENVEYFWKVLNSSSSTEDKKVADEYLRQFKVSQIKSYKKQLSTYIYIYIYNYVISINSNPI